MNCPVCSNPALPAVILDLRPSLCVFLRNIHTHSKKGDLIYDLGQYTFVVGVHVGIISETTPPERNLQNEVKSVCVESYANT